MLPKKARSRHSERRFCAKNPALAFVLDQEGFSASTRMTTKGLFPQTVKPLFTSSERFAYAFLRA
jgi:hypothetical protein